MAKIMVNLVAERMRLKIHFSFEIKNFDKLQKKKPWREDAKLRAPTCKLDNWRSLSRLAWHLSVGVEGSSFGLLPRG
jgi:hypothetical protein